MSTIMSDAIANAKQAKTRKPSIIVPATPETPVTPIEPAAYNVDDAVTELRDASKTAEQLIANVGLMAAIRNAAYRAGKAETVDAMALGLFCTRFIACQSPTVQDSMLLAVMPKDSNVPPQSAGTEIQRLSLALFSEFPELHVRPESKNGSGQRTLGERRISSYLAKVAEANKVEIANQPLSRAIAQAAEKAGKAVSADTPKAVKTEPSTSLAKCARLIIDGLPTEAKLHFVDVLIALYDPAKVTKWLDGAFVPERTVETTVAEPEVTPSK